MLSESDGASSYQRVRTLRGVRGDKHEDMLYFFFVRGNVMILDAMNQKQVINRYAKLDSSGFFGEREGETEEKTE